jgi:glutamine synthetase
MPSLQVNTSADVLELLETRPVTHVHVGITDHTGQVRGKYISKAKLAGALAHGMAMTRNFAAVDFKDVIYPVEGLIVNGDGFGDGVARIVPESCREVPWESAERNLFFLIEHCDKGADFDARVLCARMVRKAEEMGFKPFCSCELEFRLFNETPQSLVSKSFTNLELVTPDSSYLSVTRQSAWSEFFADLTRDMEHMGIPIESAHWELGPGFAELVLGYQDAMRAADNAVIYKTFAKAFALRRKMTLSFMARYSAAGDGSSSHIHFSLRSLEGDPVFHDPSREHTMSDTMRHFIGGMQRKLPELFLMLAPNVNSFKRYVPGIFAPVSMTWGIDNRTTGLRAIVGEPKSQRVENRVPGADSNPYFTIAAMLGTGLWGIANRIEPTTETTGSLYDALDSIPADLRFPSTLAEAIARFRGSALATELFGAEFVRIFSDNRTEHELEYRRAITDWELRRFLETA